MVMEFLKINILRTFCSAHLVRHGVALYFKSLLSDKIKDENYDFVLLFDDSMNSKTQSKQMDFHIRFWDFPCSLLFCFSQKLAKVVMGKSWNFFFMKSVGTLSIICMCVPIHSPEVSLETMIMIQCTTSGSNPCFTGERQIYSRMSRSTKYGQTSNPGFI